MIAAGWKRWLAIGTGIGIEIGPRDLIVTVVRARPNGVTILGAAAVDKFRQRPAAEWGSDYAAFVRGLGAAHIPATVLLPRKDVIVRQVALPGVADNELENAIGYQADSLHPFSEDEAVLGWRRIPGTDSVLVGVARRGVIDEVMTVFNEAGVKVAALTFSASVLYSASRLYSVPPAGGLLVLQTFDGGVEAYGESPSRPIFSACFLNGAEGRARTLTLAELRLDDTVETLDATGMLPQPKTTPEDTSFHAIALPYASALSGACPRLAPAVNLLPEGQRASSSRAIFIPTLVLALLLVALLVGLASYRTIADRRYLATLRHQIQQLEPAASLVSRLDREAANAYARIRLLDDFRKQTRTDIDTLNELTNILPPPIFISNLEMTLDTVNLAGEAEQAEPLLKTLDASPFFQGSEFVTSFQKSGKIEVFRIRTRREGGVR
ncbi:MAG: PilN domain-containing protein [Bryobacterales bacterium]|nr:PilN domain-containing protein [Bryobacterales bacterium]